MFLKKTRASTEVDYLKNRALRSGDEGPKFHTRFLLKNCSGRMHRKLVKVHSPIMSLDIFCVLIMKGDSECVCSDASQGLASQFSAFLQRRKVSIRLLSRKSLPTKVFLLARLVWYPESRSIRRAENQLRHRKESEEKTDDNGDRLKTERGKHFFQ